tara:strand:+ start:8060 stop:8440 length:381 start_codon:yes stop_codon:yes gene_type:complete
MEQKYQYAERQRRYAWGRYYEELELNFNNATESVENLEEVINQEDMIMTEHLKTFIRKLYKESKEKIECPICLELITEFKELETQKCGHNFHKDCFDGLCNAEKHKKIIECPLCRIKIYNKKYKKN